MSSWSESTGRLTAGRSAIARDRLIDPNCDRQLFAMANEADEHGNFVLAPPRLYVSEAHVRTF